MVCAYVNVYASHYSDELIDTISQTLLVKFGRCRILDFCGWRHGLFAPSKPLSTLVSGVLGEAVRSTAPRRRQHSSVSGTWLFTHECSDRRNSFSNLLIYLGIITSCVIVQSFAIGSFALGALRAAKRIHKLLAESIFRSTLRWLDTTPMGRIVSRFTQGLWPPRESSILSSSFL